MRGRRSGQKRHLRCSVHHVGYLQCVRPEPGCAKHRPGRFSAKSSRSRASFWAAAKRSVVVSSWESNPNLVSGGERVQPRKVNPQVRPPVSSTATTTLPTVRPVAIDVKGYWRDRASSAFY